MKARMKQRMQIMVSHMLVSSTVTNEYLRGLSCSSRIALRMVRIEEKLMKELKIIRPTKIRFAINLFSRPVTLNVI